MGVFWYVGISLHGLPPIPCFVGGTYRHFIGRKAFQCLFY